MEKLPAELWNKIFCLSDYRNLAASQQVCRKWKVMASDNNLWSNLFKERWGEDQATFYAPSDPKLWQNVYEVQDRCDRIGLGLKIIKEGDDYYLVHQGEIQRHLGSRKPVKGPNDGFVDTRRDLTEEASSEGEEGKIGILDSMIFFIGDLESASGYAKRTRLL